MSFNMENAKVDSINITKKKFETNDKIYCTINFIIIFIPIIIQIFLYIYYSISFYRFQKKHKFNQLTINQEEEMEKNKYLSSQKKINISRKNDKIIIPKWYKYLNEYFNLVKNGAELFNKNSKESNVNNINGITYIKGLLGISMILYIFGHLFLNLFNLPFKNLEPVGFISSVKNPFFCIPIVGLRYSPRIILSCSGYTLIYKYLNYIEQQPKFYMVKFILRQSYKYLLLLLVVLYMRYSVYYLNIILTDAKRPMMEILKYNLENNNKSYFINFFTCLLAYLGDSSFKNKQNIIQYFYVPLNEIFLFLFGIILMSLGYKYKFRNDIIIIIIILLIFIAKILLYSFYVIKEKKYSTLYFYLYDYGAIMLNPIFNLPSFLIGMFFGLINFSIQKGVNLYDIDSYQRIFNVDNRDSCIGPKEIESDNGQNIIKRKNSMNNLKHPLPIELNKLNNLDESKYTNKQRNDNSRSYSQDFTKDINLENEVKSYNKKLDKNFIVKSNIYKSESGSETMTLSTNENEGYSESIKNMPFLILPIKFLKFHNKNEKRFYLILIVIIFILLIALFSCAQFFYVGIYSMIDKNNDRKTIWEKISFTNVITDSFLNFIYVIDIDLVVFMVNWVFFIIYSKGYKTGDIYNFFDNNFWAFFLKCYYSFIIISTPIILSIIYQSETVIQFSLANLIFFSFINLFIILLVVILFYSMFEIPLKKIFKSFLAKEDILSDNIVDDNSSCSSNFD